MERVTVNFWRWPRRERSTDIRSDSAKRATSVSAKAGNPSGAAIPVFQRSHMSFLAFFLIVVSLLSFVAVNSS